MRWYGRRIHEKRNYNTWETDLHEANTTNHHLLELLSHNQEAVSYYPT